MDTVQTLELRFMNELNRQVTIRVPNPKPGLTAEEISIVMDTLLANVVFSGNAGFLSKKIDARIVSRSVDTLEVA